MKINHDYSLVQEQKSRFLLIFSFFIVNELINNLYVFLNQYTSQFKFVVQLFTHKVYIK